MAQTNTIISQSQKEKLERFVKTAESRQVTVGDFNRCLLGVGEDSGAYQKFTRDHSDYLTDYAKNLIEGAK